MTIDNSKTALSRHPDRSIDDKFERVVAERDDLASALTETERENDKLRAQVADLADKLHKAQQENASHTKAGTAWANEVAAKDRVIEAAKTWRAQFAKPAASKAPRMRALIEAVDALPQKAEVA